MAIKHISGWVDVTETGAGRPDNELPGGGGYPSQGLPWYPGRPDQGLPSGPPGGHIWGALLRLLGGPGIDNELPGGGGYVWGALLRLVRWALGRGHVSGGPIKPPGIPIIPIDPGWGIEAPSGPPSWAGGWVPLDPGMGLPPVWGWLPTDPGFSVGHPAPPVVGGGPITPGHWVPIDPNYGIPDTGGCPPHASTQPIWVWIAEIGPGFGVPKPAPVAPGLGPKK